MKTAGTDVSIFKNGFAIELYTESVRTVVYHFEAFAKRALCLPLFDTLTTEEIDMIFRIILRVQNN